MSLLLSYLISFLTHFKMLAPAVVFLQNSHKRDRHHKGRVRPFGEALSLGVIDKRIIQLVIALNKLDTVQTIASCQGHGFPFLDLSPYVSFTASDLMSELIKCKIEELKTLSPQKLYYQWFVEVGSSDQLTRHVITMPGLSSGKLRHVMRYRVDNDLKLIQSEIDAIIKEVNYG